MIPSIWRIVKFCWYEWMRQPWTQCHLQCTWVPADMASQMPSGIAVQGNGTLFYFGARSCLKCMWFNHIQPTLPFAHSRKDVTLVVHFEHPNRKVSQWGCAIMFFHAFLMLFIPNTNLNLGSVESSAHTCKVPVWATNANQTKRPNVMFNLLLGHSAVPPGYTWQPTVNLMLEYVPHTATKMVHFINGMLLVQKDYIKGTDFKCSPLCPLGSQNRKCSPLGILIYHGLTAYAATLA